MFASKLFVTQNVSFLRSLMTHLETGAEESQLSCSVYERQIGLGLVAS